jgi:PHP family Zn ribbon phosphoesterase
LRAFRTDLHVHTVLSPCAEIEMMPHWIIQEAVQQGIQLIAITDHNATENIQSVMNAAVGSGISVFPGMELQTREEVHVLCLFDDLDQTRVFQKVINERLPQIENDPEHFGIQLVVEPNGEIIRLEERLLITSANISINEAVQIVADLGGISVPAHVNRKGYGLIQNLGFVPEDLKVEALEISRHMTPQKAYQVYPQIKGYPLIQNGDVHRLTEFLGSTIFTLENPTIAEIRMALTCSNGRTFKVME